MTPEVYSQVYTLNRIQSIFHIKVYTSHSRNSWNPESPAGNSLQFSCRFIVQLCVRLVRDLVCNCVTVWQQHMIPSLTATKLTTEFCGNQVSILYRFGVKHMLGTGQISIQFSIWIAVQFSIFNCLFQIFFHDYIAYFKNRKMFKKI